MTRQQDFWISGTFDNSTTDCREVWQDGKLRRYARRNCCGDTETAWSVLRKPWGAFPDVPQTRRTLGALSAHIGRTT